MAQQTHLVRKGGDADLASVTVSGTLTVTGSTSYGATAWNDGVEIGFGTGSGGNRDVTLQWDGTNLLWLANLTDQTLIEWGDASATQKSFNQKWYGNAANGADFLYFDCENNLLYTTGVDMQFKDNDILVFGTGAGGTGDVTIRWDEVDLEMAATGASAAWNIGAASHVINTTLTGTLTVGVDDTGYDVKAFGATSGAYMLWDESADSLLLVGGAKLNAQGTVTVGVNDTGYDVQFFGATAGAHLLWDESENTLKLVGAAKLDAQGTVTVGVDDTGYDVKFFGATASKYVMWDESEDDFLVAGDLKVTGPTTLTGNAQVTGTLTVGVDDTGHDVTLYGATAGCKLVWDESEDQLVVTGPAEVPALKLAGAGSISAGGWTTAGTAWTDAQTPAFSASQKFALIDIAGTVYRIPLWANA